MPWVIAGGAVIGGLLASNASANAANMQADAAKSSSAEQAREFDIAQRNMRPFLDTSTAANKKLSDLLGLTKTVSGYGDLVAADPNNFDAQGYLRANPDVAASPVYHDNPLQHYLDWGKNEGRQMYKTIYSSAPNSPDSGMLLRKFSSSDLAADPVYNSGLQFGMDEGRKAIEARNIANGSGYDSSATLRQIVRYANDYGTSKASDAYNRFVNDQSNIYSRLSGSAGGGQVATNLGQLGLQSTNAIANTEMGAANARAAGIVAGANAWGGALSDASSGYNNYQNRVLLSQLLKNNSGASGGGGVVDPSQFAG